MERNERYKREESYNVKVERRSVEGVYYLFYFLC